jgi:hypothetical protein
MPEIQRPVRTVQVGYVCDSCGDGLLTKVGVQIRQGQSQLFTHKCESCDSVAFLVKSYPYMQFTPLVNDQNFNPKIGGDEDKLPNSSEDANPTGS